MYTVYLYPRAGRLSVYDETGRRLLEERVEGRVELRGAERVAIVEGFEEHGLVASYVSKPCISRKMWGVEVAPCGVGGGEE